MKLRVQYFALMREQAGRSEETLETAAATPAELYAQLSARYGFTLAEQQLKVAVNSEFSEWAQALAAGDHVVFHSSGGGRLMPFRFAHIPIDAAQSRLALRDAACGGFVSFEGWVRDHNEGKDVIALEYEAFQELAVKEGERIVTEAIERFPIKHAACIHRVGALGLTDLAVWVGVSAVHRGEAFDACRYIIDEVKHRVPIWKKEFYGSGDSGWVNCEHCAAAPHQSHQAAEHHAARAIGSRK